MTSDKVKHSPLPLPLWLNPSGEITFIEGPVDGETPTVVAKVYGHSRAVALIKSANLFPELVEALELCCDCLGHTQPDKGTWTDQVMDKAKSILSKAREK